MSIIVSLDPSTKSTGYAVFKDNTLIDKGVFQSKSKDVLERIWHIQNEVVELIRYYEPDNMAMENVMITMSAPTAKSLLGLELILELEAYKHKIPCTLIRPSSWRKTLGLSNSPKLNRAAKKQEAIDYVNKKYNLNEKTDDITDAICIGEAFLKEKKEDTN